jgi:hypothetical protein
MTRAHPLLLLAAVAGCVACDGSTPHCNGGGSEYELIALSGTVGTRDVDVAIVDATGGAEVEFGLEGDDGDIDQAFTGSGLPRLVIAVSEPRIIALNLRGYDGVSDTSGVGVDAGLSVTGDLNGATESGSFSFLRDDGFRVHFEGVFAGEESVLDIRVESGSVEGGCGV